MKLTRLTLHNFGPFEALNLDLTNNIYLVGLNGGGKSTILNAIRMALHGWCGATSKGRGQSVIATGARDLIRQGANKATVTLEMEQGTIQLEIPRNTKNKPTWEWVDDDGELHETPGDLYGEALPEHYAACATFGGELTPELLQEYLRRSVSVDDAVAASGIEESEIRMVYSGPLRDMDELREVGQQAFDKRTGVNREIKRLEANFAEEEIATPAGWADDCIDATRTELEQCKATLAKLYQERGAATAGVDPVATGQQIEDLKRQLEDVNTELEMNKESYRWADKTERDDRATHVALVRKMEDLQAEVSKLGQSKCPTCGRAFENYPADRVGELKKEMSMLEPQAKKALQVLRNAEKRKEETTHLVKEYKDEQDFIARQISSLDAKLEQPRYTAEQLSDLEASIASAQATEARLQDNLQVYQDYERQVRDQAYLETLKSERAVFTAMVEAFRDGKAVRPLLQTAVTKFEEVVNHVLPGNIRVGIDVTGKKPAPMINAKPWALASTGQRSIVRYAIATEFSTWGAVVLFDDINDLDVVNRRALVEYIREHDEVSHVVAGTWQYGQGPPENETVDAIKPVDLVWVDGVK